jgi:prephenate dehydrogenase
MNKMYIKQLTIIGVGLIGGSIAARLKREGAVGKVVGVGRGLKNITYAQEHGLIDEVAMEVQQGIEQATIVIVAVPVKQVEAVLHEIKLSPNSELVLTDVGSTKGDFKRIVERIMPERAGYVVPGHPIAGSEKVGPQFADANLFQGKNVVLCPLEESKETSINLVQRLWQSCGASVSKMSEDKHDKIFSAVSHLPHIVSYTLVEMMNRRDDAEDLFDFAAGGFRDFSRIAGSSPEMWVDICRANYSPILDDVETFISSLEKIRELLRSEDYQGLRKIFDAAAIARNNWASKQ